MGPTCAGKTTLASALVDRGWRLIAVGDLIAAAAGGEDNREILVAYGEQLERDRPGQWLAEQLRAAPPGLVLDAIRTEPQLVEVLKVRPAGALVLGLHASDAERRRRFALRRGTRDVRASFDALARTHAELAAVELARRCPHNLDTGESAPAQVLAAMLKLLT